MIKPTFGQILKELRKEQGFSQRDLEQKADQNQATISNWENGKCEPTVSAIKRLCDIFDISADYLLGLTDEY